MGGQTAPFNASLPLLSAHKPSGGSSELCWLGWGGPPPLGGSPLWTHSCDIRPPEGKDLGPSCPPTAGAPALDLEECPLLIPQTSRHRASLQGLHQVERPCLRHLSHWRLYCSHSRTLQSQGTGSLAKSLMKSV